ncbi:hypothetical protein [Streptomyces sp. LS1784]|uniref:hypothetical protein n=1 Tax=Streptomyces sp. LS1784 TaxID=2851533 RepID=UPI001CCD83A8|nr:hypothetical protein [Streptomyces sp. LS1784]
MPVPPALPPCPSCRLADQVRSVPAVYRAGRSTETVRSLRDDRGHTETRVVISDLARALAPAPDRHPERAPVVLGVLALFGTVGAFFAAEAQSDQDAFVRSNFPTGSALSHSSPDTGTLHTLSGVGLAVAIALFVTAALLRVNANRELAGRPQAERLWSQAWYCARCGTAHFSPAAGQGPAAFSLREFRRRVWTAGGYGHLADRY